MGSRKIMARELSAHLHAIRERLHGIDKKNSEASGVISFQGAHLVMSIGINGAQTMGEIARILNLTLSSITAVVDKLESKGFVRRVRSDQNRRLVRVELTTTGRVLFTRLESSHLQLMGRILCLLDRAERGVFLRLFRKIAGQIQK